MLKLSDEVLQDAYISAYMGKSICKSCEQEAELRMGVCWDCFEKALNTPLIDGKPCSQRRA